MPFFDLRLIVSRSISYACSLITVGIFFFGVEFFIEKFIYSNDEFVDIISAVAGAFAFYLFRSFFDRITDGIFFRKDYDYAKVMHEIGPLLNLTIDLKLLLSGIDEFLSRTIRPEGTVFLFAEASSPICFGDVGPIESFIKESGRSDDDVMVLVNDARVAAVVPLALKEEPRAMMFVGNRLCGRPFRNKDMNLITALAQQAGMAIRNARLYEEVRQHNEILEMKVAERTEKIRSMYESQSKFLTEISHELQTPIAILRGNVEVLQRNERQERASALRVITTTVDDMSRLVNNLLESARLKFSKNIFYKKDVCVRLLLQEVYEGCLILGEDKGISMSVESHDVWVYADGSRLKEVILNLVSNALKHTSRGGSIALIAKNNEGMANIIVRDTGCGIFPEDALHIFDRFYKIGNNNNPLMPSTGIGLNICKQIIESHGGKVSVESEIGKGSSFIIQLPILL